MTAETALNEQVSAWLADFEAALAAGDTARAVEFFAAVSYWRDLVAFTWNIKTMEGTAAIAAMLGSVLEDVAPRN